MIGAEGVQDDVDSVEDLVYAIDAEKIYQSDGQKSGGRESFRRIDSTIFLRTAELTEVLVLRDFTAKDGLVAPAATDWPEAETRPAIVSKDSGRLETFVLGGAVQVTEIDYNSFGEAAQA